ncbi:MAG: beta-propeller domain-containing protein [Clostridia bacterium]|nr:beta-propeller domain-containing protein [Clostridia bacterium]
MKSDLFFRAMGQIDDEFIAESGTRVRPRLFSASRYLAVAASICLAVLALSLILFLPYDSSLPDISRYSQSEYYEVMEKINAFTAKKPPYKNNFQFLAAGIDRFFSDFLFFGARQKNDAAIPEAGESLSGTSSAPQDQYQEITDNQVAGIIEGDRLKRSQSFAFYLDENGFLNVYSLLGDNSQRLHSFSVTEYLSHALDSRAYILTHSAEIFLSEDAKTLTVILPAFRKPKSSPSAPTDRADFAEDQMISDPAGDLLYLLSLDVSDPANTDDEISDLIKGSFCVSGNYLGARKIGSSLLLLTQFHCTNPDFSKEESFLPQTNDGSGSKSIPISQITFPDELTSAHYTVAVRLEEGSLSLKDSAAFLSYTGTVYVSEENIFVTRSYTEPYERENGRSGQRQMSEISGLGYKDGIFRFLGSVSVEGTVLNQYSMDEKDGILRVVTSLSESEIETKEDSLRGVTSIRILSGNRSASLYCIDIQSLEVTASVQRFAPEGESVRSVRFDGDTAYVCTAIQLTDPVFVFDLSDPNHIKIKDTGTIPGFSSSLIQFGPGIVVGIGVGESSDTVKIEAYRESTDSLEPFASLEFQEAYASGEYKSYLISREQGLIGLGLIKGGVTRYVLILFDQNEFRILLDTPLSGDCSYHRAFAEDGFCYLFGTDEFKVKFIG